MVGSIKGFINYQVIVFEGLGFADLTQKYLGPCLQ